MQVQESSPISIPALEQTLIYNTEVKGQRNARTDLNSGGRRLKNLFCTWFYSERWQIREYRVTECACECYTEGRQWKFIVPTSAYVTGKFPGNWKLKNLELTKYSFYPMPNWVVNFIVWDIVHVICLSRLRKHLVPVYIFCKIAC